MSRPLKSESSPRFTANKLSSWWLIGWVFKVVLRIEQRVCMISHGDIEQGLLCCILITRPVVSLKSRFSQVVELLNCFNSCFLYLPWLSLSAYSPHHLSGSYIDFLVLFPITSQFILETYAQVLQGCWGPWGIQWTSSRGHSNQLCGTESPQQPLRSPGRRTSFQAGMNKVHRAPWGCIFKHISENRPLQVGVSTLVCWQASFIRVRSPERVSGQRCPGQHGKKRSDSGSHSLCCHHQGNGLCFASVFIWDARHFCDLQSPC